MTTDVITYAMSGAGAYQSTTIDHGGILVGAPRGSGFLESNYEINTYSSSTPTTGTVFNKYDTRYTGCDFCTS